MKTHYLANLGRVALTVLVYLGASTWSPPGAANPPRGPWVWGLSGGATHQFDANFKDGQGDFSVSRAFVQPSLGYAWDRRTSVSLSLGAGETSYDFSPEARVGGTKPWGDIRDYRVSMPIRFSPDERADVILIPSWRSYSESGASVDDGSTEGLLAAAGWKFSDTLTLGPGFGWFSELGGGNNVFPVLLIDWKITDQISLHTGKGMAASQGPGLTLDYKLTDNLRLGLTARSEKTRFALDEDGNAADGVGEDKSLPLLLSVTYTPWPMTTVSALLGAEFAGSLRKEDSRGRVVAKSDFDTAPVIGLVFSSRF